MEYHVARVATTGVELGVPDEAIVAGNAGLSVPILATWTVTFAFQGTPDLTWRTAYAAGS